jgi:hypothetical protein
MVLRQAKTDSRQSNSAIPKDGSLLGSALERFQEMRVPQALRRRSMSELVAYLGILLMNTDFFRSRCSSGAIREELSSSLATLLTCLTTIV